jgi:serine/threonine protein kinase
LSGEIKPVVPGWVPADQGPREADMADEVIGGYRLLRNLATGQTSQVWEVVEEASGRHLAMKLLLPEKTDSQECRHFLLHEAEVGLKLAHDNIIRIHKVDRNPKNPFFLMELFPSGSLKIRIGNARQQIQQYAGQPRRDREADLAFLQERTQDILKQAATGLAFMNAKGWVHRDIKPDNVLVNSAGVVKLIDFAIAQRIPTPWQKFWWRKVQPQGTRSYMSPEQIRGEALDGRSDIYGFGAMAYEMISGRPPFSGSSSQDLLNKHLYEKPLSPETRNAEVTKQFADLVLQMLAKKREDRPKDFHDVLIKLRGMRVYRNVAPEKKDAMES